MLPVAFANTVSNITRSNVTFRGDGGLVLHGTIVAPTAPGHYPGLVMVAGSGPANRNELSSEATAFAQRGIVTLIYDKRTVGYSSFHRDYSVLANDAIGGVSLLRRQSNVDSALVGVFGLSEGAWVAPLAATRSNNIAYVITVGASGVTPSQQMAWEYSEWLHHAGVTGSLIGMMHNATRFGVGFGLFPEANYNGVRIWRLIHQPVLALWGDMDRHAVPAESSSIIAQALRQGGNTHYTIRFLPNAQHDLHITRNGGFDNLSELVPGYADTVGLWVNDLSHGLPKASIEAAPKQDVPSKTLARLNWYESSWVQVIVFFSMLLIFGGYMIFALIWGLRHRSGASQLRPARWLAVLGFVTVSGFFVYFGFLVSTAASHVGPVILGNPIPWIVLRLFAIATTAVVCWTVVNWYRHRAEHKIGLALIGLPLSAGIIFIIWATYWGLLVR